VAVSHVLAVVSTLVVVMVVFVVVASAVVRVVLVVVATSFIWVEFIGRLRHLVTLGVRLMVILRRLVASWRQTAARICVVVARGKRLVCWTHSILIVCLRCLRPLVNIEVRRTQLGI
jgi:hypothetical protein